MSALNRGKRPSRSRWRSGNRRVGAPQPPQAAAFALSAEPAGERVAGARGVGGLGGRRAAGRVGGARALRARRRRRPVPWRELGRAVARGAWLALCTIGALAALGGVGAAGYFGYRALARSNTFAVRTIRLEGARPALRGELLRTLEPLRGMAILRVATRETARILTGHPWVAEAEVYRALPDTLHVVVREREARAAALLGELYLVDAAGWPFKRATLDEVAGLTVITGIDRAAFRSRPQEAARRVVRALGVLARYGRAAQRPPLGELHLDDDGEVTLFLRRGGTALHLGTRVSDAQFARLDRVLKALGPEVARAQTVFLDHRERPGRVVVRMRQLD
ncbi:MAG: FtsQ-type POTRA domain-containing protein [Proteobacteria bacterium]|nr:FtsQ-type POTRA domain-containing protein [Pseudomonadota bacterium]